MEAVKALDQYKLDLKEIEDKVEKIHQETEEKILAVKNKVAAAYYKDNGLIATIDNKLESKVERSIVARILQSINQ